MFPCYHHVSWVHPAPGGKHRCHMCGQFIEKKELTPPFDSLGPDFAKAWEAHEKGEAPGAQA